MGLLLDELKRDSLIPPIDLQVFKIDNVAQYYLNADEDFKFRDFPNIAPPFGDMWLEFNFPTDFADRRHLLKSKSGILLSTLDTKYVSDTEFLWALQQFKKVLNSSTDKRSISTSYHINKLLNKPLDAIRKQIRWFVTGSCFVDLNSKTDNLKLLDEIGKFFFLINPFGQLVATDGLLFQPDLWSFSDKDMELDQESIMELARETLKISCLAISFLHCKNVKRDKVQASGKLQKRRSKAGKKPITKHYTLCIDPFKKILQRVSTNGGNSVAKSLHICRGHFRNYDDKPLFGKVRGTFWIAQHVRGDEKVGKIIKDYKIKVKV